MSCPSEETWAGYADDEDRTLAIQNELINHCERMRYRVAVLDTPPGLLPTEALNYRNLRSSKYAALYYPWVTVADPLSDGRLNLPPSGFVAGIYARNDVEHAVFKAPANEVVRLAIDFETRLNKAQQELLNPAGVNCLRFFAGRGYREIPQSYPAPGRVEHDPEAIWSSQLAVAREVVERVGGADRIAAIGITNQRETTSLWERRSGRPIHHAIVWQDRRTTDACARLKADGHEPAVREKTGLVLDPYFSATKLRWLLENVKGAEEKARDGALAFGTIDTFLVWRLTSGLAHVTDVSNASRTLLVDLRTRDWDRGLLDLFGVPRSVLPEIRPSSQVYGVTKGVKVLPDGIPVAGIAGDQQAALFGQACFSPGDAKCTYGTGAFLLQNTGPEPAPGVT